MVRLRYSSQYEMRVRSASGEFRGAAGRCFDLLLATLALLLDDVGGARCCCSAGRPAVFAVFADTPKFRGIMFAGWLPQWVWPTCKLCSIQTRGRIENHPLKTQIDL